MECNSTPGRTRRLQNFTRFGDDMKDLNGKTALPQKVYCSIEMRTISQADPSWSHIVCHGQYDEDPDSRCWRSKMSLNESADNYYHSNREDCAEIRYDQSLYTGGDIKDDFDKEIFGSSNSCADNQISMNAHQKRGKYGFKGRVGRNARERRRVRAVSGAFLKLRKTLSEAAGVDITTSKRLSKLKTLKSAINYINELQEKLNPSKLQTIYNYE